MAIPKNPLSIYHIIIYILYIYIHVYVNVDDINIYYVYTYLYIYIYVCGHSFVCLVADVHVANYTYAWSFWESSSLGPP